MGDFSIVVEGGGRARLEKRWDRIPGKRCEYGEVERTIKVRCQFWNLILKQGWSSLSPGVIDFQTKHHVR